MGIGKLNRSRAQTPNFVGNILVWFLKFEVFVGIKMFEKTHFLHNKNHNFQTLVGKNLEISYFDCCD